MEHIGEHRRAENEAHLVFGLPGLQLLHHVERDEITLLDIDAIRGNNLRHVLAQRHVGASAEHGDNQRCKCG